MKILKIILISSFFFQQITAVYSAENFDSLMEVNKTIVLKTLKEAKETLKKLPSIEAIKETDKILGLMEEKLLKSSILLASSDEGSRCSGARIDGSIDENLAGKILAYVSPNAMTWEMETIYVCPALLAKDSSLVFQTLIHETAHLAGMLSEKSATYYEIVVQILAGIPPYSLGSYNDLAIKQFPQFKAWQKLVKESFQIKEIDPKFKLDVKIKPQFASFYDLSITGNDRSRDQSEILTNLKIPFCWLTNMDAPTKSWRELTPNFQEDNFSMEFIEQSEGPLGKDVHFKISNRHLSFYMSCVSTNGLSIYEDEVKNFLGQASIF